VILPFSTKWRLVTKSREVSKNATRDARNCIPVVGRKGKLQSPLSDPHQEEDQLKTTGNKFDTHISENNIKF
jgi:hypothetical protein